MLQNSSADGVARAWTRAPKPSIGGPSRLASGSTRSSKPGCACVRGALRSRGERPTRSTSPSRPAASPPRKDPPGLVSRVRTRNARPGPSPRGRQEGSPPGRSACVRCGRAFEMHSPLRRYCGVRCRRGVEFEVRRVRRRLEARAAELARRLDLDRVNRGLLSALRGLDGRSWLDDVAALRSEIDALRGRLRVLRHPRPLSREVRRGGALPHHGTER